MEEKKNAIAIKLPNTIEATLPYINILLESFNLPREIVASDDEICYAWRELPREIMRIPAELRNELVARMCIATSVGLFDSAINYIWNAVIMTLREKIKRFGFPLVAQTLNKTFEEADLLDYKDAQLLDLCYKLELLSEDGYFFLSQCRDIRNKFSAAHLSMAQIDDRELIMFISRCCKYGITYDYDLQGIKVSEFIIAVKGKKLDDEELDYWIHQLLNTFPSQRQLLIPMLMGIYCDPSSAEQARINSLKISIGISGNIDEKSKSIMISSYNQYRVNNDRERYNAAKIYFENLKLLQLLDTAEQHSIVVNACANLINAHLGFDNFYNEPPFAKRLFEISNELKIPDTAKEEYVYSILMGYVGNPYGVSRAAINYYEDMIKDFSPKEIDALIHLSEIKSLFTNKIRVYAICKQRYLTALNLIDRVSMNSKQQGEYDKLITRLGGFHETKI